MTYNEFLDRLKTITKRNDLIFNEEEYELCITTEKYNEECPVCYISFNKELGYAVCYDEFMAEFDTVTQMGINLLLDDLSNTEIDKRGWVFIAKTVKSSIERVSEGGQGD